MKKEISLVTHTLLQDYKFVFFLLFLQITIE